MLDELSSVYGRDGKADMFKRCIYYAHDEMMTDIVRKLNILETRFRLLLWTGTYT